MQKLTAYILYTHLLNRNNHSSTPRVKHALNGFNPIILPPLLIYSYYIQFTLTLNEKTIIIT